MATVQHASYAAWEKAYGDVYDALPAPPSLACPNCGHTALRLEFVANPDTHIGFAAFWCSFCKFGIYLSRVEVPPGVHSHPMSTPADELEKIIPEYTVVEPPYDPAEDFD